MGQDGHEGTSEPPARPIGAGCDPTGPICPGPYVEAVTRLFREAAAGAGDEGLPGGLTLGAPRWVLDRISEETGAPLSRDRHGVSVRTGEVVGVALGALEQEDGLGFLAAVDVIGGSCLEMTACHAEVSPERWPHLTLALAHGLGLKAALAVETLDEAGA